MDENQKNEAIAQFLGVTGSKPSEAETFLTNCDWDVSNAVSTYFAAQEGGADSDWDGDAPSASDFDAPSAAEPEYTGPRTLDGRPAPESARAPPAASASSSRRQPPRGGIATLGSLGAGHDEESDEENEQPRDLYAGGEKSGQFVQDPNNKNNKGNDARKLVDDIMKKARENSKKAAPAEDEGPKKTSRFTGSGMTLGGDDTPSAVVPDAAAAAPATAPTVRRILHLWNDGFSVEDGPLRRFDDPANAADLAMINQGRAPVHLMNVAYGQSVDVALTRHDTDYVKPKTVWKPFSGGGHRLGSPVPGEDATPAAAPTPAASSSSGGSAAPEVNIDQSQPTLNLRIQLADGTRLPARFNTTHTIGDVYDFITRASSSSSARPWVLSTTFPNKDHTDKSQVLGEMPEFKRGGIAVQKWT